jgi:hypothetical protein
MAIRMQQRRGTSEQWTLADPVLATGEIGWESDTNKFKIGDGINNWSDLSYFLDETALGGSLDDYVPLATVGEPDGVAELDATGNVPLSQLGNVPAPDFTGYATETYVNTAVSNLVDAAPATLDTLNELAAALNDDASFATTITNSLATKQDKVTGVSDTEIGYLDGVTSAIQTQLNAKAPLESPTFTGNVHLPATTTIDGITPTELSYLNGVTSPIQTQLGDKADLEHTHLIADLTDFQVSSPTNGQALVYNGTKWVNAGVSSDPMPQVFMMMGA